MSASVGHTWDAVIELFARRAIPIRTIERASGFIATEELSMTSDDSHRYVDCGRPPTGMDFVAERALYNVLVRGDSNSSSVLVTTRFTPRNLAPFSCVSNGRWEREFEADVKARAEGRALVAAPSASPLPSSEPCQQLDSVEREGDNWNVTLSRANRAGDCTKGKTCSYREGALNMSRETAIERCRNEAKKE